MGRASRAERKERANDISVILEMRMNCGRKWLNDVESLDEGVM
jgi:hypothetical protein